ncbi:hypothetical protein PGT21_025632 [Puccinia graminis f. sp. tritici]|uniref:Uncharacterized protein n=1 Tax=Puccinia graminis f. sp. tritici TaxID=56615 RepID=A0A5B0PB05_PUCGR|nr:hypothetical protein PGT21_025632 [Puccinia graminis f. sp. tritici]
MGQKTLTLVSSTKDNHERDEMSETKIHRRAQLSLHPTKQTEYRAPREIEAFLKGDVRCEMRFDPETLIKGSNTRSSVRTLSQAF